MLPLRRSVNFQHCSISGMQLWDNVTVKEAVRRVRGLQRIQRRLAKLQLEWETLPVDGLPAQVPQDTAVA